MINESSYYTVLGGTEREVANFLTATLHPLNLYIWQPVNTGATDWSNL
jgi:hypothetical protein